MEEDEQFVKLIQICQAGVEHENEICELLEMNTFVLSSKRPLGVSIMSEGGRKGYSAGNNTRK